MPSPRPPHLLIRSWRSCRKWWRLLTRFEYLDSCSRNSCRNSSFPVRPLNCEMNVFISRSRDLWSGDLLHPGWINGAMGGRFITTLCFLRIEVFFLLVRGFIFLDGFEIDRFSY